MFWLSDLVLSWKKLRVALLLMYMQNKCWLHSVVIKKKKEEEIILYLDCPYSNLLDAKCITNALLWGSLNNKSVFFYWFQWQMLWLHQDGNWWEDIAVRNLLSSFLFQWKATSNISLILTYNLLLYSQHTSINMIYSALPLCKHNLKIGSLFCDPESHRTYCIYRSSSRPNSQLTNM